MNMSKRILTASVVVCSLALSGIGLGTADAYPPRKPLALTVSSVIIKPVSGKTKLTITNTCLGAVKIFKNGKFYKALDASQGSGITSFGKVPSGKYSVSVKSCSETATQTVYVPAFKAPLRQKITKAATLLVKYAPKQSQIVFYLHGKRELYTMPASGTEKIVVKKGLLKRGKNEIIFVVGGKVRLVGNITGTK
jgi:hypothetical protein